jgi:DNA-binding MarR family transcriptional regulator
MNQKSSRAVLPRATPGRDDQLAPITAMMSSRLIVLANLLKRGALLRYKLLASLGRRPPMGVVGLAEAVGMDKGQISRALAELVFCKLVSRAVNPQDNREVLVCLTRTGLVAMMRWWPGRWSAISACSKNSTRRKWRCCWDMSIV